MGVASFVLAIMSLFVPAFIAEASLTLCTISLILGIVEVSRRKGRVSRGQKGLAIAGIVISAFCFVICFHNISNNADETNRITNSDIYTYNSTSDNETQTTEQKVLGVGDTWVVDGNWKFTIDSVETTSYRNMFDDSDPAQVIVITYSYENLGYDGSIVDGLYIDLDMDASIVDATGEIVSTYPGGDKYPQRIPVGAKCSGVQAYYGLENVSDKITVLISKYDNDYDKQSVKYSLNID